MPEWIRMSKARLVFRYKISDLFCSVDNFHESIVITDIHLAGPYKVKPTFKI